MLSYWIFSERLLIVSDGENILISLDSRHAENIFAGSKQVELRRRNMHIAPGTIVWIYVTLPIGAIIGRVKVVEIHASSPSELWQRFGEISGLSKIEFFDYFNGVSKGVALVLENAERLCRSFSLEDLREIANGFQPPQFFTRLSAEHPLLVAMEVQNLSTINWPLVSMRTLVHPELMQLVDADL